jgi:hypothetical protein
MATANKQGVNVEIKNIITDETFIRTTDANGNASFNDVPRGDYTVSVYMPNGYVFSVDNAGNSISDGGLHTDVRVLPYTIHVEKDGSESANIVITPNIYELQVTYITNGYSLKIVRHPNNYQGEVIASIQSIVEDILPPPSGSPSLSVFTILENQLESNVVTIDGFSASVEELNLKVKLYEATIPDIIGIKCNDEHVINLKDYQYTTLTPV